MFRIAVFTLCLLLATTQVVVADGAPPARIFSQTGISIGPDGKLLPPVVLDPEGRDDLTEHRFPLTGDHQLSLRTNLPGHRSADLRELAGVISRCYGFVATATGRPVEGDVLLYILSYERIPRAYSFRVELDGSDRWSQVRLAMVEPDAPLSGLAASSHLRRLIYGTLPHELGHQLIDSRPTVLHDVGSRPSHHTRWFTEGVCEWLAVEFSYQECPPHAWRILRDRHVDRVLHSPAIRERLTRWAQSGRLDAELENDLYGASLLVMRQWLQSRPLPELLEHLARTGGALDGPALQAYFENDTDLTWSDALDIAAREGRRLTAPRVTRR